MNYIEYLVFIRKGKYFVCRDRGYRINNVFFEGKMGVVSCYFVRLGGVFMYWKILCLFIFRYGMVGCVLEFMVFVIICIMFICDWVF